MIKKILPSFSVLLFSASIVFLNTGCSSDKDTPYRPVICTPSAIIAELSEGSFNDPSTQMPFSVALTSTTVRCSEDSYHEEIELYVRLLVKRYAQSKENETYKIPYFVVLSKGNTLIFKENLEAEVTFTKLQKRLTSTSSVPLKLPLDKASQPEDYTLYIGLQIDEQQLDANYARREETPNIEALKRPIPKHPA